MSYATQADLEQLIPSEELLSLTDDDDLGVVDSNRVNNALETASITIDSYLAERYELPLASPPAILKILCTQIAGYLLHVRRNEMPETWEKQHANALQFLTKVGEGKLSLGGGDPAGSGDTESLQVSAAPAEFSRDEMDKY